MSVKRRTYKLLISGFAALVFALQPFAGVAHALTGTFAIYGNTSAAENQPGWLFNRDMSTSTPYEFNVDAASTGLGSLYVQPIGANAADKFVGENFLLTDIADVNSVSYDFKIGAGGTVADKDHFYMSVYANFGTSDPLKFYDCRYNVVPTAGSTSDFTTVTFDPTVAYPVTTRTGASASPYTCPAVPADMDTLSPGSSIRVFALNVGDTSASDTGLDGYLDNVVIDTADGTAAYDFEPIIDPAVTAQDFGTWDNSANGFMAITAGFGLADFDEVDSITVTLANANGDIVTNTATPEMIAKLNLEDWTQFSSPFVVSGTFDDTYCDGSPCWSSPAHTWTAADKPTKVTAVVTGKNNAGQSVTKSAENTALVESPSFESLLPIIVPPTPGQGSGTPVAQVASATTTTPSAVDDFTDYSADDSQTPAETLAATDNQNDDKKSDDQNKSQGGLAWYWWIVIIAAAGGAGWYIYTTYRNRSEA